MKAACLVEGCDKAAEMGRKYCRGHRKQIAAGRSPSDLRPWGRPKDAVLEACLAIAELDDPTDHVAWGRAWRRLLMAFVRYRQRSSRNKVPTAQHSGTNGNGRPRGR
jgi:hypothetical protein